MELETEAARSHWTALVQRADRVVVGLDFDGTLAPIVDDPQSAVIHPEAPAMLKALATRVRAVVVITGRPARQVVELGHLEAVADALPKDAHLAVMGQYGHERWDSRSREFTSPEAPAGLTAFRDELPDLLETEDAEGAHVEEKGLAVAVHTRRLEDAGPAYDRLRPALQAAAERHDLHFEPGRKVLEVRTPGMDKGIAVRTAIADLDAAGVVFVGDDRGDLEAFEAVRELTSDGAEGAEALVGLLVCSGSDEEAVLRPLADVVVDGPAGVVRLLTAFAEDAAAASGRADQRD